MKKLAKKIGTGILVTIAAFGLLTSAAFAHTNLSVSGSGSGSQNIIRFTSSSNTNIWQDNDMSIMNAVAVSSMTGGNRTYGNTGANTSIRTGDASSQVTITNQGNTNAAARQDCMNMTDTMSMGDMMNMMQGMENIPMDQMMQMCMQMDMCKNMSMEEMMRMCQQMGMDMMNMMSSI